MICFVSGYFSLVHYQKDIANAGDRPFRSDRYSISRAETTGLLAWSYKTTVKQTDSQLNLESYKKTENNHMEE
jgi:hypothetical protein